MTKRFTLYLGSLVVTSALLGACSRPVAYFQPEHRVHYAAPIAVEQPTAPVELSVAPVTELNSSANTTIDQLDAYVRNDTKLAANKQLSKRVDRLKKLLPQSTTHETIAATAPAHKANVFERLIMKKLNKKISKHLSPNNPKKPMANGGLLAGGAVLLLGGILLMILSSGTAATIGLIAAIIGLLALIFGLLAS